MQNQDVMKAVEQKAQIWLNGNYDETTQKAIKTMMTELDKYTFVPDEVFGATYNGHESVYGDTSYSVLYSPLNHSAIYSAAISVEVGIGGIH